MILVAFASRTGNVRRFVTRLGLPSVEIREGVRVDAPFFLVTYTTGFGEVPFLVEKFLEVNRQLVGVAASGNRNWGDNFARAGDLIADEYGVPVLHKFELSGTDADVEFFRKKVQAFETC